MKRWQNGCLGSGGKNSRLTGWQVKLIKLDSEMDETISPFWIDWWVSSNCFKCLNSTFWSWIYSTYNPAFRRFLFLALKVSFFLNSVLLESEEIIYG